MRAAFPLLIAGVLHAPIVGAQVPAGGSFRVNVYTAGTQSLPVAAADGDGSFVVAWLSEDGPGYDLMARRFDAGGVAQGIEFQVDTSIPGVAYYPAVSGDARGRFVVAWESPFDAVVGTGVRGRRFNAAGALLGSEFQANTYTTGFQSQPAVAVAPGRSFTIVWSTSEPQDGSSSAVVGRRFDGSGYPLTPEFIVNTYTTGAQFSPAVAAADDGRFVVVWSSISQDGDESGVFGQRFDAAGGRVGGEFQVNTFSTGFQGVSSIAMNGTGEFVVAWQGYGPSIRPTVWVRRYDATGAPLGAERALTSIVGPGEVLANAAVAIDEPGNVVAVWNRTQFSAWAPQIELRRFRADGTPRAFESIVATAQIATVRPQLASDAVGNLLVTWHDAGVDEYEVFARRYGGLLPAALSISDGDNGVLEGGDSFTLATAWQNLTGAAQTFQSSASGVAAPTGLALTLISTDADYGTVANGTVATCAPCIAGTLTGTRPGGHADASLVEGIRPDAQGQAKRWTLHIGDSFTDLARTSPFYRSVETLLHNGVTGGCGGSSYCPGTSTTREQMAPFVLGAKEGAGYAPPACTTPVFADMPASSPFCRWIEELTRRGVVTGCGAGNYCPGDPVTREQMAVFVLRTLDSTLDPPACTTPMFADVPASSGFCRWIEELARRGVVTGCGGGNYCPSAPVTREQMAVFLTGAFGLTLYGP